MQRTTLAAVIDLLATHLARNGIPEIKFAQEWGFQHVISSPHFPWSNGMAERTVRTAKAIIRKNLDINWGLLAYRSTARFIGRSPAELLMGRRLRDGLPASSQDLRPDW